ncbi:uncharacterized protein LOC143623168 [Bidens hawaiensis]|uniref:uncharacterized protein LOC143623168 n=1 Tax=Bidens hawaiensis TaxID=980011 RepID=UPI00404913FF
MASSSSFANKKYDVLLSFSGEDTRKTFVDHLYAALDQRGICTFKDDEKLEKGKRINDELLQAIEDSRVYIIVFSKHYASSSWCLNELLKIMECHKTNGRIAFPVFYDVDTSDVRKQTGSVGEAFAKHKDNSNGSEVRKWREALKEAANLSGWDLKNTADGHEAKVIKLIIERVSLELRPTNMNFDESLVGMEQRIQDLDSCLEIGLNDVRMIGIKGMGGAGKTTLARAIFDKIAFNFEGQSFVENVRENALRSGLKKLQKHILKDVLKIKDVTLSDVHEGKRLMKKMLRGKKVLVLDDVHEKEQLEMLVGDTSWFKPGSRIIITTREGQVLRVKWIHDVNLLSDDEAIHLFCRHAFGKEKPTKEYESHSQEIVRYAAGLPLTIKVLGSNLCGKTMTEWRAVLARLKTIPLEETLKKLELSYDSLEDDCKDIFLDVACILKDWKEDDAIRMLENSGYYAKRGLRVLEQKSLMVTSKDTYGSTIITMHDHLVEMGMDIVRREYRNEPHKHSRLWVQWEIEQVLANNLVRIHFICKAEMKLTNFCINYNSTSMIVIELQGCEARCTRYSREKEPLQFDLEIEKTARRNRSAQKPILNQIPEFIAPKEETMSNRNRRDPNVYKPHDQEQPIPQNHNVNRDRNRNLFNQINVNRNPRNMDDHLSIRSDPVNRQRHNNLREERPEVDRARARVENWHIGDDLGYDSEDEEERRDEQGVRYQQQDPRDDQEIRQNPPENQRDRAPRRQQYREPHAPYYEFNDGVPRAYFPPPVRGVQSHFVPQVATNPLPIIIPVRNGRTFSVRQNSMTWLPTFHGKATEEPYLHLSDFNSVCALISSQGFTAEEVKMVVFQFSLKDVAKQWFLSLPSASIFTWGDLAQQFLDEYYTPQRTTEARNNIRNFQQLTGETFYESFQRMTKRSVVKAVESHGSDDRMDRLEKKMDKLLVAGVQGAGKSGKTYLVCEGCGELGHEVANCGVVQDEELKKKSYGNPNIQQNPNFQGSSQKTGYQSNQKQYGNGSRSGQSGYNQRDSGGYNKGYQKSYQQGQGNSSGNKEESIKDVMELLKQMNQRMELQEKANAARDKQNPSHQSSSSSNSKNAHVSSITIEDSVENDTVEEFETGAPLIPIQIGKVKTNKALVDYGASVSVLPGSVYDRFNSGPLQEVDTTLVLADFTRRRPQGKLVGVAVKRRNSLHDLRSCATNVCLSHVSENDAKKENSVVFDRSKREREKEELNAVDVKSGVSSTNNTKMVMEVVVDEKKDGPNKNKPPKKEKVKKPPGFENEQRRLACFGPRWEALELPLCWRSKKNEVEQVFAISKLVQIPHFPNSLRYLYWYEYPHRRLPKTFEGNNLVSLEMPDSKIKKLWKGRKVMEKLRFLDLSWTKLRSLDLGLTPKLERLNLAACFNLVKLDVHGGCLKSLIYLDLSLCHTLKSISFMEQFESLEVYRISNLWLRDLHDYIIKGHSNNSLLELDLSNIDDIEEIPSSIENLHNLVSLYLRHCSRLKGLPRSLCSLQHLTILDLSYNIGIEELPEDIGQLKCLEYLDLANTKVKHLPNSICMLKRLKTLFLIGCDSLEKLPEDVGELESLEKLNLNGCSKLREIPNSICKLKRLKELELGGCERIKKLPNELGNLGCLKFLHIKDSGITHLPQSNFLIKGLKIEKSELKDEISDEDWNACTKQQSH